MKKGTFKHSEEHKRYMSERMRGVCRPGTGLFGDANPVSRPEVRAKISATKRANPRMRTLAEREATSATLRRRLSLGEIRTGPPMGWKHPQRGKSNPKLAGPNNPNWRGGVDKRSCRIRHSADYFDWRKAVIARDGHVCRLCGNACKPHVDHIHPFSLYPAIRFAVWNGRVLCEPCHVKLPTSAANSVQGYIYAS